MPAPNTHEWITLASCAGHLALASVALLRLSKSALAAPLSLLCLDLFAYNAADVAGHITGAPEWIWFDAAASSLVCPIALDFVLVFVGRSRTLSSLLRASYLYFGLIAAACASAFLGLPWARAFAGSQRWALLLAAGGLVVVYAFFALLVAHLRRASTPIERARTWLVLGAFALGSVGNVSDLLADAGAAVPRLGPLGTLMATLVLAAVALGLGLFEQRMSPLLIANAIVAGTLQILGYLAIFHFFGGNSALLTLATVTLTLALAPAALAVVRAAAAQRQRLEYHATLGRFAAQMAHDLRNPLSAIKGATQFLDEERAQGASFESAGEYLTLILEQAERLDRVIANYQRLGRVEPQLALGDINALVESVVESQTLAAPPRVAIDKQLAAGLPPVPIDPDLLAGALENIIRNAFEAMPTGGTLRLCTEFADSGHRTIVVSATDTGGGMDPRARDRLFADFYTTKATGSGLGLPFVKRVIEAHGGAVTVESAEHKGTTVQMHLPIP